jgi:hypothetical protein
MITVPRMARGLRKVFDQDARALAREMGVIKRERKLNGATLLLLLVLGWLHQPKAGPSALARFAGTLGVTISKQGIEEHWTLGTAQWLYEVLLRAVQCLVTAQAVESTGETSSPLKNRCASPGRPGSRTVFLLAWMILLSECSFLSSVHGRAKRPRHGG